MGVRLKVNNKYKILASTQRTIEKTIGDSSSIFGYVDTLNTVHNWLENEKISSQVSRKVEAKIKKLRKLAVLKNLWVDEDERGNGYGNSLVSQFLDEANLLGAEAVILISDSGQEQKRGFVLQKFWESFGFEKIANTNGGPLMFLEL